MTIARCLLIAVLIIALMSGAAPSAARECPSPIGRYARGWTEAVATVDGSEFYFGNGSALMIRHADRTYSEIETGAMVLGIEVADDYVYVVGDGGLRIVDLLAPGGPAVVGRCPMPGVAESVELLNGRAYVSGGEWGVRVVDVTVPTDPVELGGLDTPGWAADIAVDSVNGYPISVVADSGPGLLVIDATDPEVLEAVMIEDVGHQMSDVDAAGGYAYATGGFGGWLSVIDLSTPGQPEIAGSWSSGGGDLGFPTSGLAVEGGFAYVAGKNLYVVDVSIPTHIFEVAELDLDGRGKDVAAAQNRIAVPTGETIHFFRPSNPQIPGGPPYERKTWHAGHHRIGASGITGTGQFVIGFEGSFAFFENPDPGSPGTRAAAGLHVFNVGDPDRPTVVGEGLPDQLIWDAEAVGDLVFAVTGDGRFRVVDLSDPTQPRQIGVLSGRVTSQAHDQDGVDVEVEGDLAVVAGDLGLVVVDITDPTNPIRLGELPDACFGLEVVDDRAYVADADGIHLVDLTDPSAPAEVDDYHHYFDAHGLTDFEIAGGYAYLVAEFEEFVFLTVVDLEGNDWWLEVVTTVFLGEGRVGGLPRRDGILSVAGSRLALALSNQQGRHHGAVAIIDISDPTTPVELSRVVTPGQAHAVMIRGRRIYVGDGSGGLGVYNGRPCMYTREMPPEGPASSTR